MSASNTLPASRPGSRALNIGLWGAQVFIAVSFCAAGVMKLAMPIDQLAGMWPWTGELPATFVRLLGAIDFAGGAGVLLPALTRIKPGLTVLAALGCIALQVCAFAFHASRGEFDALPVNVVFFAVSAFIFWGRWKKLPIQGRTAG
jgi:uncharacterized membrane protein YphA (DoxX/SURF4 family)